MVRFRKRPKYSAAVDNGAEIGSVETLSPEECKDAQTWKRNRVRTTQNINTDYFYSIPNSKLLTLMIVVAIIITIVLFFAFKEIYKVKDDDADNTNTVTGAFLSMVALPVGVVLSFIVASAWTNFSDAQAKENQEATQLLVLYNAVAQLPDSKDVLAAIEVYTAYIIDVEFPLMVQGQQSQEGTTMLFNIGDMIYALAPVGQKEQTILAQSISVYESVVNLRIARMGYTTDGLASELWWVLVLGVIIVIIVSFFMVARSLITHAILLAMSTTALVAMLFLILALDHPYRGDLGINSLPFQIALYQMQLRSGQIAPIVPANN